MPNKASSYVVSLMSVLSYCHGRVMLVANMILKYQNIKNRNSNIEYFREQFNKVHGVSSILKIANWTLPTECYVYNGTGEDSRTKLGTIIFWKE